MPLLGKLKHRKLATVPRHLLRKFEAKIRMLHFKHILNVSSDMNTGLKKVYEWIKEDRDKIEGSVKF